MINVTPIQATVGLGALQQRLLDSLLDRPILAPFPPCQGQLKTVPVFPDILSAQQKMALDTERRQQQNSIPGLEKKTILKKRWCVSFCSAGRAHAAMRQPRAQVHGVESEGARGHSHLPRLPRRHDQARGRGASTNFPLGVFAVCHHLQRGRTYPRGALLSPYRPTLRYVWINVGPCISHGVRPRKGMLRLVCQNVELPESVISSVAHLAMEAGCRPTQASCHGHACRRTRCMVMIV